MRAKLVSYLSYPDAGAAVTWLDAIGFTVVTRQDAEDGTVRHAELRLDDALVMLASNDRDYQVAPLVGQSTGAGMCLVVSEVDAMYESAITAGASSVFPPEDTEWGARRARVLDPGGREWSFGSYDPGVGW